MKLLLVLMVCACALAAAAPNNVNNVEPLFLDFLQNESPESRNILVNTLIRQLIAYVRRIINNGSAIFGIPPLDPLDLEHFHLYIPAGLINLDLDLKDIHMNGIGSFVVHTSNLNLRTMTFDLDISVPKLEIRAGEYDLIGDLFNAIPLYGKGQARFYLENFSVKGTLHLKQSDDGKSVLIDRIDNASFAIPLFKSDLTGVIGGGDIDAIVNAMIEDVIIDYVNRFQGAISTLGGSVVTLALNPILGQLDTWKYLAPLMPKA